LIRVARGKIRSLSPPFSVIHAPGRAARPRPAGHRRHKQREILKHWRTKCDNSAWLLTPLDRKYPLPRRPRRVAGQRTREATTEGPRSAVERRDPRRRSAPPRGTVRFLPSRASLVARERRDEMRDFRHWLSRLREIFLARTLATLLAAAFSRRRAGGGAATFRFPMAVQNIVKCQISITAARCVVRVSATFRRVRDRAGAVPRPMTFAALGRRRDVDSLSLRNGEPPPPSPARIVLERRETEGLSERKPYAVTQLIHFPVVRRLASSPPPLFPPLSLARHNSAQIFVEFDITGEMNVVH